MQGKVGRVVKLYRSGKFEVVYLKSGNIQNCKDVYTEREMKFYF